MLTTIKHAWFELLESSLCTCASRYVIDSIQFICGIAIGFTVDVKTIFRNLLQFAIVIQYQTSSIHLYSTVYQDVGMEPRCCIRVENGKRRQCSGWHSNTTNVYESKLWPLQIMTCPWNCSMLVVTSDAIGCSKTWVVHLSKTRKYGHFDMTYNTWVLWLCRKMMQWQSLTS